MRRNMTHKKNNESIKAHPALAELESTANVGEAKRDLVLRFVRDQESLQTSQVDLKLVNDETIDLIDSAISSSALGLQQNNYEGLQVNHLSTGVTGIDLDGDETFAESPMPRRPPSGRPQSRRVHGKLSSKPKEKRKVSHSRRYTSDDDKSSCLASPTQAYIDPRYNEYACTPELGSGHLNSSWPQGLLSRKLCSGNRNHSNYTPERHLIIERSGLEGGVAADSRPMSTQSYKNICTREVIAARVDRERSANDPTRITCNIGHFNAPLSTRTANSSAAKQRSKSRGRTLLDLGLELEPIHPSEIPMLRATSASGSVSSPYTLVQLPPIARETPAATPPFG